MDWNRIKCFFGSHTWFEFELWDCQKKAFRCFTQEQKMDFFQERIFMAMNACNKQCIHCGKQEIAIDQGHVPPNYFEEN